MIIKYFGKNSYQDNELNKSYISNIIFNNQIKIDKINSLVHPFVFRDFNNWKKNITSKYIIFESALIFETGSYKNNDFNILVVSDLKERIKRVIRRDRVKEKDVLVRIKNQWNDEKKIPLADYIFKNNSLMDNREKVIEMIKIINNKFK
jgi:dephospho-CoA kinase